MKVSVIGTGLTGQAVLTSLPNEKIQATFNSKQPVSTDRLKGSDVAIIFVTKDVLSDILPELLESKIPVVCGTTGFDYTNKIISEITAADTRWIVANNFSISMCFIQQCLKTLGQAGSIVPDAKFNIHEIHHTKKTDAPSGTAISWKNWLNTSDCSITYDRQADVKGLHTLTIDTPNETISLTHTAKNRGLFAEGAIWSAHYLLDHPELAPGIHQFSTLLTSHFNGDPS